MEEGIHSRTELLLGTGGLSRLQSVRILIFGVGGVGSWCAECLVRSGICNLTIVDFDLVAPSNCNRQLMATSKTIGRAKVEVLRERLLEINPDASITALEKVYDCDGADSFHMEQYDFIVDAIDSLKDKADLILRATALPDNITFISSMGAALRRDPFIVRQTEFWNVKGDPLARALRKKFKHIDTYPARKFQCVYSEEKPMETTDNAKGSLCHITATFGMAIAGIIINKIIGD